MIEIQCTSCHTRYRIDERVLPDDTPIFKCSRCGHVFNADPLPAKARPPAAQAIEPDSQPAQTLRPPRPRASTPRPPAERRNVARGAIASVPVQQPEAAPPPTPVEHRVPERAGSESLSDHQLESNHPLDRTFGDREQRAGTGENFKFDFSDERHEMVEPEREIDPPENDDDRWQVGDAPPEFDAEPARDAPAMIDVPQPAARPAPASTHQVAAALKAARPHAQAPSPAKGPGYDVSRRADDTDDLPMLGKTYSSGYFVAMFFLIAVIFVAASSVICTEPIASARVLSDAPRIGPYFARPIVPAMLVALHDVHSEYRALKGGQVALVITGSAQNVGARPLHLVQIDADLLGGGTHPLTREAVYCGNELSAKMLGEMTPREIEFSQGLSPEKTFGIEPSNAAPFLMVFVNPPAHAGSVRLSVSKAVVAESAEPAAGGSARRR